MGNDVWQKQIQLHFHYFYDAQREFVSTDNRFGEWVMVMPEAGQFRYELDNARGNASFGEVVCVAPGGLFRRHVTTPSLTYHVLQWRLFIRADDTLETAWMSGAWKVGDTTRLLSDFAILRRLQYKLDDFSVRRREIAAQDILHLLWETRHVLPSITDPLMQQAAELLRARAADNLSMKAVASEMGLGPVQFTRRFYAHYGMNPITFLTAHRLELAQRMLTETDLTVDAIATRCGWTHGSYLSRVFVQHFGIAPGEFRRVRRI